jgi:hypothetical protein
VYGFPLEGLTPQQRADRAACAAYEARRRAKWQVFVERQELPTGAVLKRYCRKVGAAALPQYMHAAAVLLQQQTPCCACVCAHRESHMSCVAGCGGTSAAQARQQQLSLVITRPASRPGAAGQQSSR